MNVHETLEYLEDLDVPSGYNFCDDEDLISRGRLVVLPLNEKGDRDTNDDSGDKNELPSNNLNKCQLSTGATIDLSTSSGKLLLGAGDEDQVAGPSVDVPSKKNRRSKVNPFLLA